MKTCSSVLLLLIAQLTFSQSRDMDVQHYRFELSLTDASDTLRGRAFITVKFLEPVSSLTFDLTSVDASGKGMVGYTKSVVSVHSENKLKLKLDKPAKKGSVKTFEILYAGIPRDGLIISKTKYGQRCFFADNWPDRARNWLPCVDDPADKASVEFIVTAPSHYGVISNGLMQQTRTVADGRKLTHWKETVALPTKIMVIGVAEFAIDNLGDTLGVAVSSWVYPKDKEKLFYDYALAKEILPYFIKNIAPFPYRKLANVQSKTIFGGMENAGCIFYSEAAVSGTRRTEDLLSHEIVHQWFGDNVTEKSFAHLWLSEGFATYFTDLYMGSKHGLDSMNKRLQGERAEVIEFSKRTTMPVVDSLTTDFMKLLNANSYQKGAWALHMLNNELGHETFMNGVREYYKQFAGANASTEDFRKAMETASGKDLGLFFKQWLYTPGHPVLEVSTQYDAAARKLTVTITQKQKTLFNFNLEVQVQTANGDLLKTFKIDKQQHTFTIDGVSSDSIIIDPNTKLLFEKG